MGGFVEYRKLTDRDLRPGELGVAGHRLQGVDIGPVVAQMTERSGACRRKWVRKCRYVANCRYDASSAQQVITLFSAPAGAENQNC